MLAFLVIDGVSTLVGGSLLAFLPLNIVQTASGAVFIVFGIVPLIRRKEKETAPKKNSHLPLFATFSMIALMELGGKTQLITSTLAAEHPPLMVLVGLTMAFALLTGVAVLVVVKLVSKLPMK